jgi:hypothetical protein
LKKKPSGTFSIFALREEKEALENSENVAVASQRRNREMCNLREVRS